jgi:hypothetical protein
LENVNSDEKNVVIIFPVSLLDGETSLPRLAKSKHKISLERCITVQQFDPRFRGFYFARSLVIDFFLLACLLYALMIFKNNLEKRVFSNLIRQGKARQSKEDLKKILFGYSTSSVHRRVSKGISVIMKSFMVNMDNTITQVKLRYSCPIWTKDKL